MEGPGRTGEVAGVYKGRKQCSTAQQIKAGHGRGMILLFRQSLVVRSLEIALVLQLGDFILESLWQSFLVRWSSVGRWLLHRRSWSRSNQDEAMRRHVNRKYA
jgi:hypothetical protein